MERTPQILTQPDEGLVQTRPDTVTDCGKFSLDSGYYGAYDQDCNQGSSRSSESSSASRDSIVTSSKGRSSPVDDSSPPNTEYPNSDGGICKGRSLMKNGCGEEQGGGAFSANNNYSQGRGDILSHVVGQTMPEIDWETLEDRLKASQSETDRQPPFYMIDREAIRAKLAADSSSDDDDSVSEDSLYYTNSNNPITASMPLDEENITQDKAVYDIDKSSELKGLMPPQRSYSQYDCRCPVWATKMRHHERKHNRRLRLIRAAANKGFDVMAYRTSNNSYNFDLDTLTRGNSNAFTDANDDKITKLNTYPPSLVPKSQQQSLLVGRTSSSSFNLQICFMNDPLPLGKTGTDPEAKAVCDKNLIATLTPTTSINATVEIDATMASPKDIIGMGSLQATSCSYDESPASVLMLRDESSGVMAKVSPTKVLQSPPVTNNGARWRFKYLKGCATRADKFKRAHKYRRSSHSPPLNCGGNSSNNCNNNGTARRFHKSRCHRRREYGTSAARRHLECLFLPLMATTTLAANTTNTNTTTAGDFVDGDNNETTRVSCCATRRTDASGTSGSDEYEEFFEGNSLLEALHGTDADELPIFSESPNDNLEGHSTGDILKDVTDVPSYLIEEGSTDPQDEGCSVVMANFDESHRLPQPQEYLRGKRQIIQEQARLALSQAPMMAKMQMEVDRGLSKLSLLQNVNGNCINNCNHVEGNKVSTNPLGKCSLKEKASSIIKNRMFIKKIKKVTAQNTNPSNPLHLSKLATDGCNEGDSETIIAKMLSASNLTQPSRDRGLRSSQIFIKSLCNMPIAQIQILVNAYLSKIERFNEELVQLLMERDELHMEQDSILVDIEDITGRVKDKAKYYQQALDHVKKGNDGIEN